LRFDGDLGKEELTETKKISLGPDKVQEVEGLIRIDAEVAFV
jgi:hypothetical protein